MVSKTKALRCRDPACQRAACYTRCRNVDGLAWCSAKKKPQPLSGAALTKSIKKAATARANGQALKDLVCLQNRRLSQKTNSLELTGKLAKGIRALLERTPARHRERSPETPHADLRLRRQPKEILNQSQLSVHRANGGPRLFSIHRASGDSCEPTKKCTAQAIVATLKLFETALEEMYGVSTALIVLGRAVGLVTAPTAAKTIDGHSIEAVAGAAFSVAVALEMGALEWDGLHRSVWVTGSSTRAPYFTIRKESEAAHTRNMLSCEKLTDLRSSSTPSGTCCLCDAKSAAQCRCVWLALAPRGDVIAAEWALLGVEKFL